MAPIVLSVTLTFDPKRVFPVFCVTVEREAPSWSNLDVALQSTPVMETFWRRQSVHGRDVTRVTEKELID